MYRELKKNFAVLWKLLFGCAHTNTFNYKWQLRPLSDEGRTSSHRKWRRRQSRLWPERNFSKHINYQKFCFSRCAFFIKFHTFHTKENEEKMLARAAGTRYLCRLFCCCAFPFLIISYKLIYIASKCEIQFVYLYYYLAVCEALCSLWERRERAEPQNGKWCVKASKVWNLWIT